MVLPWGNIQHGTHPAVQFLERMDEWYNWGNSKYEVEKNNVKTLKWEECIKDDTPCDANKEYYLHSEKHLAYKRPYISNKTAFHIGEITFEPFDNN